MYFLFYALAFDDVMKSGDVEFKNLIFSRTKRAFEIKNIFPFLVWKVLSFRLKKQTSRNVADTTYKGLLTKRWRLIEVIRSG